MPKQKKHKWDVAISYAGEDRKIADRLVTLLKAENKRLSVFYDRTYKPYLWGKKEEEYENIYGPESRFFVPLISKYYKQKDWPRHEFSAALKEAKKRKEEFILPIRVDDSQLLGLRNDVNYMDIREYDIKEIAKILIDKCKMLSKKEKNNRSNVNNQICILSRKSRYVLGIIATSIFFTKLAEFSRIFPDVKWQRELNWLSRKGLVIKKKHSLDIPKTVKNAVLRDLEDIKEFNQAWIKALKPFQNHIDVAIMLSLHYLHIDEFNQAVSISANMVERMEPSWWIGLYLTLFKSMIRKKIFAHIKPDSRIRLYNAIGLCLSYTGKNAEAVKWFLKLRHYSLSCKNKWGIGQSYINCGVAYHKSANNKKAKVCYEQAIKHARRVKDDLLLSHSLNNLAQIVVEDSFEEAEKLIEECILIKKKRKDYVGLVTSYGTLGYLAARSGEYEKARKWFLLSQKKARILRLGYSESLSFFNIGNVCFDLKEFNNAYYYYARSYRIAEKNGYSEIIEMNIEGKAKACFEMGWFRKAELKFGRLLELIKHTNQDSRKLIALDGISASLMKQGIMLKARKTLRKALKLAYKVRDLDLIVKLSICKALTYDGGKLGKTAIKALENEIANAQKSKEYLIAIRLWIAYIAELINLKDTNRITKAFKNGTYCLNNLDNNYEIKIRFYAYLHFWQWYTGNHKAGIETLKIIERIAVKGQHLEDQANAIDQRGVCLQELGQLNKAESSHKKALKLARKIASKRCIQASLNNLGEAYRKTNRTKKAIRTFLEAEQVANEIKDYESEISTAHNRALALEAMGRTRESGQVLCKCRDRSMRLNLWGEYVRSWEGLGNLAWYSENLSLAIKRFKKALLEAKNHKQHEVQPEIALNLARIFLYQGKAKNGLQILKPYEAAFSRIIDSYEYYGTLAALYEESGRLEFAKNNYVLAKESASHVGNKSREVSFCANLAEIYGKQKRPKLSDMELKRAIANENNPKDLVYLLIQRLSLLLNNNQEKAAKQVFNDAMGLISKHDFSEEYIDIHMLLGDHNWKGSYRSKLNAMQAYIVASTACLLHDTNMTAEIGSHIIKQLLRQPSKAIEKLINKLENDITNWLLKQNRTNDYVVRCLLWPLRAARKMYPYRFKPKQLKNIAKEIISEERAVINKKS